MSEDPAILICSHGSRDRRAVEEFRLVEKALKARLPGRRVASGFLEFAEPTIARSLESLAAAGATEVWALPGMLFAAMHMKTDIPEELDRFTAAHPEVRVRFGAELGLDWRMLEAARDRIATALAHADKVLGKVALKDTLLLVVGRGTSDPDANGNIAKVARMLGEVMGFGWTETGFSGLASPTADVVLFRELRSHPFARVAVFPYFLFTGILVDRIYGWADAVAERFPEVQMVKVPYLKDHPQVIDTFVERLCELARDPEGTHDRLVAYRAWMAEGQPTEGEPWMKRQFDSHHDHDRDDAGEGCCCGHDHDDAHPHDEDGSCCCGGEGHGHDGECGCGHDHADEGDDCCCGHHHPHGS